MREHPILMSAPMVRAILNGRKTQTRRVVKPQPPESLHAIWKRHPHQEGCPYGVPGDRRWVRETFMFTKGADAREAFIGTPDEALLGPPPHYAYRATEPDAGGGMFKWRPSIHMPRWASRITLEVVDVRAQRVQDISEEDAMAEGVEPILVNPDGGSAPHCEGFRVLWDSINAKRGFGWAANPFAWCIKFRPLEVRG